MTGSIPGAWGSGNPAFTLAHGSGRAGPYTPSGPLRFANMLLFPLAFAARSVVDPWVSSRTQPPCGRDCTRRDAAHIDARGFHHHGVHAAGGEPVSEAVQIGGQGAKLAHGLRVTVGRHGNKMGGSADVDPS